MVDRRHFFRNALGLGITSVTSMSVAIADKSSSRQFPSTEFEQLFANVKDLWPLGIPRSWSVVREGLHPISPERIITLNAAACSDPTWRHKDLRERLQEKTRRYSWHKGNLPYSTEKFNVILHVTERLSGYYRLDCFENWAEQMARREALASTGIGRGFGLLHDFQGHDRRVETVHVPADWWVVQFPDGFDWDSVDGEPTFLMVGPVLAERRPGSYLDVLSAIQKGTRLCSLMTKRIARMDRVTAARTLNAEIARSLLQWQVEEAEWAKRRRSTRITGKNQG